MGETERERDLPSGVLSSPAPSPEDSGSRVRAKLPPRPEARPAASTEQVWRMLDSLEEAELPNLAAAMDPRLFQPLTSLTLTPDRKIRRMATHLLRSYEQHADYPRAMAQLRFVAADENRPAFERRRAIAALSQLRNEGSVSLFVELLPEADRGVAAAARVGLRVLTAHDFGFTREPWLRWFAGHSFESRVDWLIDGLGDSRAHLRALASRELAQLTGLKVALPVDASRAAFVAAQREYELWWAGLGHS